MGRRGGRALGVLATAVATSALVVAFLHANGTPVLHSPPDRAALGAARAAVADGCADVLLVGVDGGGETPATGATFGRTVEVFRTAFQRRAVAGDRSLDVRRIAFTGAPPARLVAHPHARDARRALSAPRARAWREPVPGGVTRTLATIDEAAVACPGQQVVLAGFAQGASVVHRALLGLQDRADGLSRVAGAVLVSDPDRRSRSVATHRLGDPAAARRTSGVFPELLAPVGDVPAGTQTFAVWNVCTRGDLVCDPGPNSLRSALETTRSYRFGAGAAAVRSAAAGLWATTTLWPLPRPELQVATARTGQSFSLQLGVTVAPAAAPGVVWTGPGELPPGLTLDGSGLLSGTPTEAGTWNLSYTVRGTRPPTTEATGVVVLTVQATASSVSAGGQVSCETRTDGTAWCWGRNNFGQLGDGSRSPRSTPVRVGADSDWESISTSGSTTCGVRSGGTLWCWGLDNFGQLGVGRGAPRLVPVRVGTGANWATVSASWFHTCGTRVNGSLWCWGQNRLGQLGDGTTTVRAYPTRVGTGRDWASVTAGGFHTCGTRADGTAWCWGQNAFGQLGTRDVSPHSSPVRVGTLATWVQLSAGWAHTCGVTAEGAASCWGLNNGGQLGDGSRSLRLGPVPVSGDRIWTSISTGDASTCGLDNTGSAYCWGSNRYGQLGDGSSETRMVPTLVSSEHPWLSVDAGWFHACGDLGTGDTSCWGNNEAGQVGNGTQVDQPVPEEVR